MKEEEEEHTTTTEEYVVLYITIGKVTTGKSATIYKAITSRVTNYCAKKTASAIDYSIIVVRKKKT